MPRRYRAKERADRERRLEALEVEVLTALGERDGLVLDAERRAGQALRTMTDEEGLSLREAAEWCGSGVRVREIAWLLRSTAATRAVETMRRMTACRAGWARCCIIWPQCGGSRAHLVRG